VCVHDGTTCIVILLVLRITLCLTSQMTKIVSKMGFI